MKHLIIGLVFLSFSSFGEVETLCLKEISTSKNGTLIGTIDNSNKKIPIGLGLSRDSVKNAITESFTNFIEKGYNFSEKNKDYKVCLVNPNLANNNVNYIDGFYISNNL